MGQIKHYIDNLILEQNILLLERGEVNIGDFAEIVLGVGLVQRFIARGAPINENDIVSFLKNMSWDYSNFTGTFERKVADENGQIKDTIIFNARVRGPTTLKMFLDKSIFKHPNAQKIISSVVAYVNSDSIVEQSLEWFYDNKPKTINIIADGVSGVHTTKVDVQVLVDGQTINMGKISLKALTAKKIGQVGNTIDAIFELFDTLFGFAVPENLQIAWAQAVNDPERDIKNIQDVASKIYGKVSQKIAKVLDKNAPNQENIEAEFLKRFAEGVRKIATMDEEGVLLLHLGPGTFEVLDFHKLPIVFEKEKINLSVEFFPKQPKLVIYNKTNKEPLLTIRLAKDRNKIYHYIEKERGLSNLIKIAS